VPGLLIPQWAVDGSNVLYVFRPDKPRIKYAAKKEKAEDYQI
jgi:hypothetical protein